MTHRRHQIAVAPFIWPKRVEDARPAQDAADGLVKVLATAVPADRTRHGEKIVRRHRAGDDDDARRNGLFVLVPGAGRTGMMRVEELEPVLETHRPAANIVHQQNLLTQIVIECVFRCGLVEVPTIQLLKRIYQCGCKQRFARTGRPVKEDDRFCEVAGIQLLDLGHIPALGGCGERRIDGVHRPLNGGVGFIVVVAFENIALRNLPPGGL